MLTRREAVIVSDWASPRVNVQPRCCQGEHRLGCIPLRKVSISGWSRTPQRLAHSAWVERGVALWRGRRSAPGDRAAGGRCTWCSSPGPAGRQRGCPGQCSVTPSARDHPGFFERRGAVTPVTALCSVLAMPWVGSHLTRRGRLTGASSLARSFLEWCVRRPAALFLVSSAKDPGQGNGCAGICPVRHRQIGAVICLCPISRRVRVGNRLQRRRAPSREVEALPARHV